MNTLKYLVLIGALYAGTTHGYAWWKKHQADQALSQSGVKVEKMGLAASCEAKKYCITAYIAPWCGVCRSSEPTFHALHEKLPKLRPNAGFGVVIGAASPSDNAEMKKELAPIEAFTDDNDLVMRSRRVNSFPTWIVTDTNGKELLRLSGGIAATEDAQLNQFLMHHLKVD